MRPAAHLAFRAYGDFRWPPLPVRGEGSARGTVAIYYAGSGEQLSAYLQWIPGESGVGADAPPPDAFAAAPFLGHVDAPTLRTLVGDSAKTLLFRLGPPQSGARFVTGPRLLFSKAAILDQHRIGGGADAAPSEGSGTGEARPPDMRWLLARTFNIGSETHHSAVFVGADGDSERAGVSFGFDIGLPTPSAQTVDVRPQTNDDIASFAFAFRVSYRPTLSSTHSGFVPLRAIRAHGDREEDLDDVILEAKHLGGFGFAKSDGGKSHFQVPRRGSPAKHWLQHSARYRMDVLEPVLSTDIKLDEHFDFRTPTDLNTSPGDEGEFWNSISVRAPQSGVAAFNFRSAISLQHTARSLERGELGVYEQGSSRFFHISDPFRPGRRIRTAAKLLLVDLELGYAVADEEIWREIGTPGTVEAEVRVRFGFESRIPATALGSDPSASGSVSDIGWTDILAEAAGAMRLGRSSLSNLEPAQPQSILADIAVPVAGDVRFALCGTYPARFLAPRSSVGRGMRTIEWGRGGGPAAPLRLTIWPEDKLSQNIGDKAIAAKVRLDFPSFCYAGGSGSAGAAEAELRFDPSVHLRDCPHRACFELRMTKRPATRARLGGLEFVPSAGPLHKFEVKEGGAYGYLRFAPRSLSSTGRAVPGTDVEIRLRLALDQVEPVGADVPRGDRSGRPRPLLIKTAESRSAFGLDLRESLSERGDRHLQAYVYDLQASGPAGQAGEAVLISEQPFSIVRFASRPLKDRGGADATEVANYDSDDRSWRMKQVQAFYTYEFPPQAVGESMDRPGRMEIVDRADRPRPHPPYEVDSAGGPSERGNALRRTAVEFRLTPSAAVWIRPSDVERGYFLPEWATGQLFRQRGAFGLGAAVAGFRAEYLYGLAIGVDPSLEEGAARGARLAEIEALLGSPLGAPRSADPDPDLKDRWRALTHSFATRPERLEMWMRDPASARPFVPARFERGVRFALRDTAVFRSPFGDDEGTDSKPPRIRSHGLAGGAIWPLESRNFFESLRQQPVSSGGAIEGIALSPSGGDADQRAEFLNGKLAIISETRNGHVQRHRVEITGRISAFWHRAKHVVVYERTTSASAQFTPTSGAARTRRPVLRKVAEYIELLQPVRGYPDFPVASRQSSGFLRAVRFNSRIINVDSAWGGDVGKIGWRVPLWNRDSANRRPSVYPRPDIAFVTAAEGEGEQPVVAQECLDPDNLYFFADAEVATADTDLWPSRIGIDCADLPAPVDKHQHRHSAVGDGDSRQPNPSRYPRGHRLFTWRLAPAARKTAINAERGEDPIYAGLETLTFMRSSRPEKESEAAAQIADAMAWAASPLALPRDRLKQIAAAQAVFGSAIAIGGENDIRAAAQALVDALKAPAAADLSYAKALLNRQGRKLHDILGVTGGRCEGIVGDFAASLHRKKLLLLEHVRDWSAGWRSLLPAEGQNFTSYDKLIEAVMTPLMKELSPALHTAGEDIGRFKTSVEKARAVVGDFESETNRVIACARRKKDEIVASYDQDKPWSPARIEEYQRRIASVRDGIIGDIDTAILEVESRLAAELDSAAVEIAGKVAGALRAAADANDGLRGALGRTESAATAFVWQLHDKFGAWIAHLAQAVSKLESLDVSGDFAAEVAALRTRLSTFVNDAQTGQALLARLASDIERGGNKLDSALATIADALPRIQAGVSALIDDVRRETANFAGAQFEAAKALVAEGLDALAGDLRDYVELAAKAAGEKPDWLVRRLDGQLDLLTVRAANLATDGFAALNLVAEGVEQKIGALRQAVLPAEVSKMIQSAVVRPFLEKIVPPSDFAEFATIVAANRQTLHDRLQRALGELEAQLVRLDEALKPQIAGLASAAEEACKALQSSFDKIAEDIEAAAGQLFARAQELASRIEGALADINQLKRLKEDIDKDLRAIAADLSASHAQATAYADRVFEEVGRLDEGGVAALPNNILRLYAAAASAPALPNLDFARERLGYYYKELNNIIDTTPAEAWFGRLGDELKAMGLSLPFEQIGSGLLPKDLSNFDIGRIFRNFGGIDLSRLFRGVKLPAGAKDAIKISHAFDKKQARAWVQVDVDVPLPGRRPLFTVGPFKLDFVDSRLVGVLRIEASKDSETVAQTGRASLHTDIDATVSGQSMVTLQKVALRFERQSGLKVDLNPKNIRLNPSLRFIQDTLGNLFPAEAGGFKIVKRGGIPVGVEHEFSMPPMSLMAGTSGVSNIHISNRFALIAYPDFVISNRFALSRPDMPFLFSIFVIGGTGYVLVDCEYRPFRNELMVMVEAAAGGSAALGFSAGPVSGSVFVTLSVALSYRKLIGSRSGGGLTASVVLLIAGTVDVAGIVSVYMGLLLRMSYHENGQIDGVGTLSMSIRISRFFKIKVRRHVQRQLRGPQRAAGRAGVSGDAEGRASELIEARG